MGVNSRESSCEPCPISPPFLDCKLRLLRLVPYGEEALSIACNVRLLSVFDLILAKVGISPLLSVIFVSFTGDVVAGEDEVPFVESLLLLLEFSSCRITTNGSLLVPGNLKA